MTRVIDTFKIVARNKECLVRIRNEKPKFFSEYIVELTEWPREDLFGPIKERFKEKFEIRSTDVVLYDRITELLKGVGLVPPPNAPRYYVHRLIFASNIYISLGRGYVLENKTNHKKDENKNMKSIQIAVTSDARLYRQEFRGRTSYRAYIHNTLLASNLRVALGQSDRMTVCVKDSPWPQLVAIQESLGIIRKDRKKMAIEVRLDGQAVYMFFSALTYEYAQVPQSEYTERKKAPIHENTHNLLKSTAVEMGNRLRSFEKSCPQDALSWERTDWESVCIERIQEALRRGKVFDAMNYLMFAQHHGWDTSKVLVSPECRTVSTEDIDSRTIPYTFATYKDYCDYNGLYSVLIDALDQAAYGKGMERHANNLPFEEQKMQTICDAQGSSKGMAYQAIKKILESEGMGYQAKKREILGAIVYAAGIIIWEEKQPIEE